MPGGDVRCVHDDAPPVQTARSTSFFAASAEARALSCFGTGTEGNRLQALYVTEGSPSLSAQDRAAIELGMISTQTIYESSSAAVSDERLIPRWVHGPGCEPSIEVVSVPPGTLDDFGSTLRVIAGLGYDRSDRKYIVWADTDRLCGIASVSLDERENGNANDGGQPGYARIDRGCWAYQGVVVAHEVTHTLGAVLPSAPNATPLGHCTDEHDIMCYDDGSGMPMELVCPDRGGELILDCNNDDYFHPSPAPGSWLHTHWNVADSSFLERIAPDVAISVGRFSDVPDASPMKDSIEWLADRGVTRGCGESRFCPEDPVTRGQMAAFLHRFAPEAGSSPGSASAPPSFDDVPPDTGFAADIGWLAGAGVTRGCDESSFCPDAPVTRAQMAAFLHRLFVGDAPEPSHAFFDVPTDHAHAGEIAWLARIGVSNGCGEGHFCPEAPVTRGQMAAFLHRIAVVLGD